MFLKRQNNQFKMVYEMYFVQQVSMRNVLTFQPTEFLVFATVKSKKPAPNCLKFLFKTENRRLCSLVVMVHTALQKRRVATVKKEIHLHFCRIFSANHYQAHPSFYRK